MNTESRRRCRENTRHKHLKLEFLFFFFSFSFLFDSIDVFSTRLRDCLFCATTRRIHLCPIMLLMVPHGATGVHGIHATTHAAFKTDRKKCAHRRSAGKNKANRNMWNIFLHFVRFYYFVHFAHAAVTIAISMHARAHTQIAIIHSFDGQSNSIIGHFECKSNGCNGDYAAGKTNCKYDALPF